MKRSVKRVLAVAVIISAMLFIFGAAQAATLKIPAGTKVIEEEAFYGDTSIEEVILPEGIKEIGPRAFAESGLKRINLPSTLEPGSIADNAFDKEVKFTVEEGTDAYEWAVEQGYNVESGISDLSMFEFTDNGDGTCTLSKYVGGATNEGLRIPSSWKGLKVKKIGRSAFLGKSSIKGELILPATIETIEQAAFASCTGLVGNVILPSGLKYLGSLAFEKSNLTTVTLPDNIEYIDQYAFSNAKCELITTPGTYADDWNSIFGNGSNKKSPEISDIKFTVKRIHYNEEEPGRSDDALHCEFGYKAYAHPYTDSRIFFYATKTPDMPEMGENFYEDQMGGMSGNISSDPLTIETLSGNAIRGVIDADAPGSYYLWIMCTTENGTTIAGPVEAVPEDVYISKYVVLTGKCVTKSGDPIKNVEVTSSSDDSIHTYSDAQGNWRIDKLLRGSGNDIVFSHPDYYFDFYAGPYGFGESYTESLDIGSLIGVSKYISGKITTDNGEPLANVAITAKPYDGETLYTTSKNDGTWSLLVEQDLGYTISYWLNGYKIYNDYGRAGDSFKKYGSECPVYTVSGTVKIGTEPAGSVLVYALNENNEVVDVTLTDHNGKWTMSITSSFKYNLAFMLSGYSVGSGTTSFTLTRAIDLGTVTLVNAGTLDDSLSFTMKQKNKLVTSIQVGSAVDFTVTAPNAAYVRLVVDEKEYEAHKVNNGTASFSRIFSSKGSGTRKVQVQSYTNEDGWLGISEAQNLQITDLGKLEVFQLTCPSTSVKKHSIDISWVNNDSHAQYYSVYVFGPGGTQLYPDWRNTEEETENPALSRTIPADVFQYKGTYSIQVVATGEGYSSVTVYKDVEVKDTDLAVELALASYVDPNNIGIGDKVDFNVSTSFNVEDPTYELISSDTENSVVDGDSVMFKKAQSYKLTVKLQYNGEEYTSNEITVNVKAPTVGFTAEVTDNGIKKSCSQYCWEVVGSTIKFILKPNFTPSSVTMKNGSYTYDAKIIKRTNAHEYTATIALDLENVKEEYKFTLTDCNGKTYGPYCIPVYVMEENPNKDKDYRLKPEVVLYKTPLEQSTIAHQDYAPVKTGEGLYNGKTLIKFYGTEYFVNSGDIIPSEQTTGGQGILAISHDFTENVVYTNQDVTYTVTTDTGVKSVQAVVEYIPASAYGSSGTNPTKFETKPCEKNGTTFTFTTQFSQCGQYYINFIPTALDGTVMEGKLTDDDVYSVKAENERTVYYQWSEYGALFSKPTLTEVSHEFLYTTPLVVLGDAGNNKLYMMISESGTHYGFISKDAIKNYENPVERRAYVYVTNSMLGKNEKGKEHRTNELSRNAIDKMTTFLQSRGFTICSDQSDTYRTRGRNTQEIRDELAGAANIVDFNDETIVYIFSHGLEDESHNSLHALSVLNSQNKVSLESSYVYTDLASDIAGMEGYVTVIVDACMSGDFINYTRHLSEERYTIITASNDHEAAHFSSVWYKLPIFTKNLVNMGIEADKTGEDSDEPDGFICADEIDQAKWSSDDNRFFFLSTSDTQVWGNTTRPLYSVTALSN